MKMFNQNGCSFLLQLFNILRLTMKMIDDIDFRRKINSVFYIYTTTTHHSHDTESNRKIAIFGTSKSVQETSDHTSTRRPQREYECVARFLARLRVLKRAFLHVWEFYMASTH